MCNFAYSHSEHLARLYGFHAGEKGASLCLVHTLMRADRKRISMSLFSGFIVHADAWIDWKRTGLSAWFGEKL